MTRRGMLLSLLALPILTYAAICIVLFFAQDALLFPVGQVGPPGPLPRSAERLELAAASGDRLRGVLIPPDRPAEQRLLILGFGGNAWNGDDMARALHGLYPQADVIAFSYRGYPPSEGRPSAAALQDDAVRIHDVAVARLRPARTIAVGFSIGSGIAASLAAHRDLDGAILVTPFDSLGKVAASQYPWLPVRLLFRNPLDPARDLADRRLPVAIVAAARDRLILPARTDALRRAVPDIVFDTTIAGVGHNDIYGSPAFPAAMTAALARIEAPPPGALGRIDIQNLPSLKGRGRGGFSSGRGSMPRPVLLPSQKSLPGARTRAPTP